MNKIIKRIFGKKYIKMYDYIWCRVARFAPKLYCSIRYKQIYKKRLNWKNPRDLNEKIQWLKFYGDTSQWPRLADKYAVREYVKERGLEDILVPLIGKWDKAEDIPWETLPNKFVMKTNHGCGDALICTDKSRINTAYYTNYFSKRLKERFGLKMGEAHYDKIKPCIIAEELLDATMQDYPSSSPIDYKLFCFDGKPTYFFVCFNRTKDSCDVATYDTDWNIYPQYIKSDDHFHACNSPIPRPHCLEKMLDVAQKLTKGLPCVRLDMYEIDHHVYFGEMTLTPAAGFNTFFPQEFLNLLGDCCSLPIRSNKLS